MPKGPGRHLDQRCSAGEPLPKGLPLMPTCPKWNNKGKPAGSGTVTQGRREAFKKKALARELKHMGEEDVQVPSKRVMALKARLLTPEEVQEYLKPKPKPEPEPDEALDQRASGVPRQGHRLRPRHTPLTKGWGRRRRRRPLTKGRPKEKARPKALRVRRRSPRPLPLTKRERLRRRSRARPLTKGSWLPARSSWRRRRRPAGGDQGPCQKGRGEGGAGGGDRGLAKRASVREEGGPCRKGQGQGAGGRPWAAEAWGGGGEGKDGGGGGAGASRKGEVEEVEVEEEEAEEEEEKERVVERWGEEEEDHLHFEAEGSIVRWVAVDFHGVLEVKHWLDRPSLRCLSGGRLPCLGCLIRTTSERRDWLIFYQSPAPGRGLRGKPDGSSGRGSGCSLMIIGISSKRPGAPVWTPTTSACSTAATGTSEMLCAASLTKGSASSSTLASSCCAAGLSLPKG